jgi:hypothetical protein
LILQHFSLLKGTLTTISNFFKYLGFIKLSATEITISNISVVVGAKVRKKDLTCNHHNSIGLKSGEYGY